LPEHLFTLMKFVIAITFLGFASIYSAPLYSQGTGEPYSRFHYYPDAIEHAQDKLLQTLDEIAYNSSLHPSHTNSQTGKWEPRYMKREEWTSGFFAGSLWYMYQLTGNDKWKDLAAAWTEDLKSVALKTHDHDTGFRIMNSFGNGYRLTQNRVYFRNIAQASVSLSKRYNPNIGAIKSWDWIGNFPVIIDNLMNLELLFFTSKTTGNKELYQMAFQHAETSLKHHMRPDGSTYHIVDFDNRGNVNWKDTRQGFGANSAWARGQAWAIYGFTMIYRYTEDERFLNAAVAAANFFIENLPPDFVPPYDFREPEPSVRTKDVSASAITASALFELYTFTNYTHYFNTAAEILNSLSSHHYSAVHTHESSILRQSTLHRGKGNVGTSYADYYYLEAIIRYKELMDEELPELMSQTIFYLEQNYPNPFNNTTRIMYSVNELSNVEISIFDITGRRIKTIINEQHLPGTHNITFHPSGLSTGTYFYSLTAGGEKQFRKMVLIK
jgi:unsaturated chondroitin disaccharide hydrolase